MHENWLEAQVTFVESLGSATHAYCSFPGAEESLTCTLPGSVRLHDGESLRLQVPPESAYLFDAAGKAFRRHAPVAPGRSPSR